MIKPFLAIKSDDCHAIYDPRHAAKLIFVTLNLLGESCTLNLRVIATRDLAARFKSCRAFTRIYTTGDTGMAGTTNAFEMAQRQFDHVAELLKLDPQVCEMLRWPMREFHFRIPVRMDDGTIKVFQGFRVQHLSLIHI
jgi:hypothetical protein